MATSITGKPTKKVGNMSIVRADGNGFTLTAKWKVGSQLTTTTSKTRATYLRIVWTVTTVNSDGKESKVTYSKDTSTTSTTVSKFNPCNFKVKKTTGKGAKQKTVTTSYTRTSYYPYTTVYLKSVTVTVYAANNKGVAKVGASTTYTFGIPGFPTVSDLSQAGEYGLYQAYNLIKRYSKEKH